MKDSKLQIWQAFNQNSIHFCISKSRGMLSTVHAYSMIIFTSKLNNRAEHEYFMYSLMFHKYHINSPFTSEQTAIIPLSVLNRNDGRTPNVSLPIYTFPLAVSTRQNEKTPSRLLAISSAPTLVYKWISTSPSLSVSNSKPCSSPSWDTQWIGFDRQGNLLQE